MGGHNPLFLLRLFTVDHHIADPVHQGTESPEAIAGIHFAELQDHAHTVQQFERIRSMKALPVPHGLIENHIGHKKASFPGE